MPAEDRTRRRRRARRRGEAAAPRDTAGAADTAEHLPEGEAALERVFDGVVPWGEDAPAAPGDVEAMAEETAEATSTSDVRVHEDRLDRRSMPVDLTPSEALALATFGRDALRRFPDDDGTPEDT